MLEPPYNVRLDRPLVTSDSTSEFPTPPDDHLPGDRDKRGRPRIAPRVHCFLALPASSDCTRLGAAGVGIEVKTRSEAKKQFDQRVFSTKYF